VSTPRDHHFIPAFYLQRWHASNGKLIEYSLKNTKLISKTVSARATGYERDLYTFPDLPSETRQILESQFFNQTDFLASKALSNLYTGNVQWDSELRTAWSRFLLNFRVRHPDPLKELRAHISVIWNRADPHYEAAYAKARGPEDPATLVDYTASLGPEAGAKIQLGFLHKLLDNQRIGQQINEMQWDVLDLSKASHTLLTSDWPAEVALRRGSGSTISLPIGPTLLFIATSDADTRRRLLAFKPNKLVALVNQWVTAKARRYAYACDTAQATFIERYISKDMMKPPLWPSLGTTTP
jgi:hypothetical protein